MSEICLWISTKNTQIEKVVNIMDNFYNEEISPIELLGYAKNYIIDVLEGRIDLPHEEECKLLTAYRLLTQSQEYFYNE